MADISAEVATDDLTSLAVIDEDILLQHLRNRFKRDIIYTFVGDILIAVNPYKTLDIYGSNYVHVSHTGSLAMLPHIYTTTLAAYRELVLSGTDQCCIISGESGAGKTETCKHIVRQLTELSSSVSSLEQRILQVNPLLEAFGNAKTQLNFNSSRFGKYLQIRFLNGRVAGAKINEYLLEKSRVVQQNPEERNFHIFYWMICGMDANLKQQMMFNDINCFRYLGKFDVFGNEKQLFNEVRDSFDLVGFNIEEQKSILECLSAILHIGNINIEEDENEFSCINRNSSSVNSAAELLGIEVDSLISLLTITMAAAGRREMMKKHLSRHKAEACRDAISKALYDRLFRWIVSQINRLLMPKIEELHSCSEIGILDIFGFEQFVNNSFEQLCINLANEQLHHFFSKHIFQQELEEYSAEGITGIDISVQDNQLLLDTFLSGHSSILALLDDECAVPKATDLTFLEKLDQTLKKKSFYHKPKSTSLGKFGIYHFAGEVTYSAELFLEKNRDSLPPDAKNIFQTSHNDLVNLLFRASISSTGTLSLTRAGWNRTTKRKGREKRSSPKEKALTIGSQFKNSLNVLVRKLNAATPHFIRCIKPNATKSCDVFDDGMIRRQLRYSGMLETVHIRQKGFGYRPTYEVFLDRFGILSCDHDTLHNRARCEKILLEAGLAANEYQFGHTKLFLKHRHLNCLTERIDVFNRAAVTLQRVTRGLLQRRRYARLLECSQEQMKAVKELLEKIFVESMTLIVRQEKISEDDIKVIEERRKSKIPITKLIAPLPPPSGLYDLPPPLIIASDDEGEEGDIDFKDEDIMASMDLVLRPSHTASHSRQARLLHSSVSVSYSWLHGMISQKQAEKMLSGCLQGTFLVRQNRKRVGHPILSYRSTDARIAHINVTLLPNDKYVLDGETMVHDTIECLVNHYIENSLALTGDCLTVPCDTDLDNPIQVIMGDQSMML